MLDPNPIVRAAVTALDTFGARTYREARTLLAMWARYDQLTPVDVALVLSHYQGPADTGLDYSRPTDEPTGAPLPAGVDGYRFGRDR